LAGAGIQSSALSFGGTTGTISAVTEEYDADAPSVEASPEGVSATTGIGLAVAAGAASAAPSGVYAVAVLGTATEEIRRGYLALSGPLGTPALFGEPVLYGALSLAGPLGTPAWRGASDFAAVIGSVTNYYVMDVTGTPTLRIPISSWQCTLNATAQSYLQASLPAAADYALELLTRREAGESFQIRRGGRLPSGPVFEYLMATALMQQVRIDRGPERYTITLIGYSDPVTAANPTTRALDNIQLVSLNGTSIRLRGEINWQMQPGDTVTGAGQSFTARYITYYVGDFGAYMDVGS
jgi:hypothetical protein